jgi:hypothetical protein
MSCCEQMWCLLLVMPLSFCCFPSVLVHTHIPAFIAHMHATRLSNFDSAVRGNELWKGNVQGLQLGPCPHVGSPPALPASAAVLCKQVIRRAIDRKLERLRTAH